MQPTSNTALWLQQVRMRYIARTSFLSSIHTPVAARRAARTPPMLARVPHVSVAGGTRGTAGTLVKLPPTMALMEPM